MNPEVVIPGIAGIALGYLVLPAVGITYAEARKPRCVSCPADHQVATVRIDPKRAALSLFSDAPPRVTGCSRWPGRADCDRACEASLA